jgi:UPF0716 family protein affecting phage T7 exclusion
LAVDAAARPRSRARVGGGAALLRGVVTTWLGLIVLLPLVALFARAAALDLPWREVRRDRARALRGRQCGDVAGAGRHVQDLLAGRDRARVDELAGSRHEPLAQRRVVGAVPRRARTLLELGELRPASH